MMSLRIAALREDVPYFSGVGELDAHEVARRGIRALGLGKELRDGAEIVGGDVGGGGADGDGLGERDAAHLVQIGRDEGDGGETFLQIKKRVLAILMKEMYNKKTIMWGMFDDVGSI